MRGPSLLKNTTTAPDTHSRIDAVCGLCRELCCLNLSPDNQARRLLIPIYSDAEISFTGPADCIAWHQNS